jgi:hypothetical protein
MSLISPKQIEIAGFILLKLGSLKRKESAWFSARDKEVMTGLVEILKIANEMAIANDIDPSDAYQIVSSYGSSEGSDLLVPYSDRLAPLVALLGTQESTPAAAVTMILRSRLDSTWLANNKVNLSNCYGIQVEGEGWQDAYTEELPEEAIDLIWAFIQNERNRWKTPEVQDLTVGEGSASTQPNSNEMMMNTGTDSTGQSNSAFEEQPCHVIEQAIERIRKETESRTNLEAISIARLTSTVIRLGGGTPPEDFGQMLPFPPEHQLKNSNHLKVSKQTADIFFKLLATNELPTWAVADLLRYCKTWQR